MDILLLTNFILHNIVQYTVVDFWLWTLLDIVDKGSTAFTFDGPDCTYDALEDVPEA